MKFLLWVFTARFTGWKQTYAKENNAARAAKAQQSAHTDRVKSQKRQVSHFCPPARCRTDSPTED